MNYIIKSEGTVTRTFRELELGAFFRHAGSPNGTLLRKVLYGSSYYGLNEATNTIEVSYKYDPVILYRQIKDAEFERVL